jgi:hypothetical protein
MTYQSSTIQNKHTLIELGAGVVALMCIFSVWLSVSITVNAETTDTAQVIIEEAAIGCKGVGSYGSVGLQQAQGTFVPVSESAVSLNTYLLVQKECILDQVANKNKQALLAQLLKKAVDTINTERGGLGSASRGLNTEMIAVKDKVVERIYTSGVADGICAPYRDDVKKTVLQNYYLTTRKPSSAYTCSFTGTPEQLQALVRGDINAAGLDAFRSYTTGANSPLEAFINFHSVLQSEISSAENEVMEELRQGAGFFSVKKCEQIPVGNGKTEEQCRNVTPGSVNAEMASYLTQAGFRQVEDADEVGELTTTMLANLQTQVLSSFSGLSGLSQSQNGSPSYLGGTENEAGNESNNENNSTVKNALLQAIKLETTYIAVRTSSQTILSSTLTQLQTKEKACYTSLVSEASKVLKAEAEARECAIIGGDPNALNANSCGIVGTVSVRTQAASGSTTTNPRTLHIITVTAGSTRTITTLLETRERSTTVIADSIAPIATIMAEAITAGQKALAVLNQLLTTLNASSAATTINFVLKQLNTLITTHAIHNETDIATAREQLQKITDTMSILISETSKSWESTWCKPSNWRDSVVPNPTNNEL